VAPTSAWADVTGDDGLELPVSASEVTVDEVEGRQIAAVPIAWDAGSASPIGAERSTEKNLGKDQGGLLDVEELRLAPDVCGYDELDLILTVQEDIGSDIEVRLLTATTFEITGVGGRWV
jgi:hypothetical protein